MSFAIFLLMCGGICVIGGFTTTIVGLCLTDFDEGPRTRFGPLIGVGTALLFLGMPFLLVGALGLPGGRVDKRAKFVEQVQYLYEPQLVTESIDWEGNSTTRFSALFLGSGNQAARCEVYSEVVELNKNMPVVVCGAQRLIPVDKTLSVAGSATVSELKAQLEQIYDVTVVEGSIEEVESHQRAALQQDNGQTMICDIHSVLNVECGGVQLTPR